jgi:hypothetical protein
VIGEIQMKWILFIMLFVTPPKNVTKEEITDKKFPALFEKHRLWTLQATSTMEFSSLEGCFTMQAELQDSMASVHVATLTSRVWCACDSPDNNCPNAVQIADKIKELADQRKKGTPKSADREGRELSLKEKPSKSFTIRRLYPPEE